MTRPDRNAACVAVWLLVLMVVLFLVCPQAKAIGPSCEPHCQVMR
jgi:hypothetical protein